MQQSVLTLEVLRHIRAFEGLERGMDASRWNDLIPYGCGMDFHINRTRVGLPGTGWQNG